MPGLNVPLHVMRGSFWGSAVAFLRTAMTRKQCVSRFFEPQKISKKVLHSL